MPVAAADGFTQLVLHVLAHVPRPRLMEALERATVPLTVVVGSIGSGVTP